MINSTTHQGLLPPILRQIFPGSEIVVNSRKWGAIKNPTTGKYLELDVWIPEHNLIFEFQDSYHYTTTWYSHTALNEVQERDNSKQEIARNNTSSFITVPCWWNGELEDLKSTIAFYRPDLIKNILCDSIALNPPASYFKTLEVPNVGELMLASFPVDLNFIELFSSSNSWWIGEKYDGIRSVWNPIKNQLYTRHGRTLPVQDSFLNQFPSSFLDGELWFGRGLFSYVIKLLTESSEINYLSFMRLITFDIPFGNTRQLPFEDRYAKLLYLCKNENLIPAPRILTETQEKINFFLKISLNNNGEGIIAQQPKSLYIPGRSSSLLKVKSARIDQEGLVMEIKENDLLKLKLPRGDLFSVPYQNLQLREEKVKVGDIVSFSYDSFSRRAIPMNVKIFRIRKDLEWEQVVDNYQKDSASQLYNTEQFTMHKYGYWTTGKGKNLKEFFEELARSKGLDPLLPSTWYQLPLSSVHSMKGGSSIKNYMKGGYVKTLLRLFPNIGLDESKFEDFNFRSVHWKEVKERRKGIVTYAAQRGFDGRVPENWYSSTAANISDVKVLAILQHYSGSIKSALLHLFPEIGLDDRKFLPRKFWKEATYRRQFLENFASKERFDPLSAKNWYTVSASSFTSFRGGREVLQSYNQNLAKAVVDLFPDINANESLFSYAPKKYWQETKHRRAFFDEFSKKNVFDPLVPGNWYRIPRKKIIAEKGSERVLSFYNQSVAKALVDLYPDIGLDINKFSYLSDAYWKDIENRRKFFEKCARVNGVDPLIPDNWYKLFSENKIKFQSQVKLLDYYQQNIPKALLDVFPSIGLDETKFNYGQNYWEDLNNRKILFENFAKENNFNPHSADDWFKTRSSFAKESKGVLMYYNGSLTEALVNTFPEIDIENSNFSKHERNYWQVKENRKKWFEDIAKNNKINTLSADAWYRVDRNVILNTPGAREVLYFYDGRISRAIADLFPHLMIDKSKFVYKETVWKSEASRRGFFEEFAKSRDFDPLNPNNWYLITGNDVSSFKSPRGVLSHYDNSLSRALVNLFPEIGLEESKFHKVPRNYWQDSKNREKAVKNFAKEKNFDPQCSEMWSPVIIKEFRSTKQGAGVLKFYSGSIYSALQATFPNVHHFNKNK